MPRIACSVWIPAEKGGGWSYRAVAASALEAAAQGLDQHVKAVRDPLPDDVPVTVIVGGAHTGLANFAEKNRDKPTYRYRAGRVRRWLAENDFSA